MVELRSVARFDIEEETSDAVVATSCDEAIPERNGKSSRRIGYVRRLIGVDPAGGSALPSDTPCIKVFTDVLAPGATAMPGLETALRLAGPGDMLVVRSLSHLGPSSRAVIQVLERLHYSGVAICSADDGVAAGSDLGEALPRVGAILVGLQRELKRTNTRAGQRRASSEGRLRGARRTISPKMLAVVRNLMSDTDLTMSQIAESIGTTRNTLYRTLKREEVERDRREFLATPSHSEARQ